MCGLKNQTLNEGRGSGGAGLSDSDVVARQVYRRKYEHSTRLFCMLTVFAGRGTDPVGLLTTLTSTVNLLSETNSFGVLTVNPFGTTVHGVKTTGSSGGSASVAVTKTANGVLTTTALTRITVTLSPSVSEGTSSNAPVPSATVLTALTPHRVSNGTIAGVVVGGAASLIILSFAIWLFVRRRRRRRKFQSVLPSTSIENQQIFEKEAKIPQQLSAEREVVESGGQALYEVETRPSELEGSRLELGTRSPTGTMKLPTSKFNIESQLKEGQ